MQEDLKSIKERARAVGLPHRVWSRLASMPDSKVYEQNLSNWLNGEKMSTSKIERLLASLKAVEHLVTSVAIRPDLSDETVVRKALERLAEQEKQKPAEAPYVGRAAAAYDAAQTTSASKILSEESKK